LLYTTVMEKKLLTVVYVRTPGRILLGMKKRGFGEGLWNGFGGKVNPGEDVAAAAARELHEEAGIVLTDMQPTGVLTFYFGGKELEIHYFTGSNFTGEPTESEEMLPRWFSLNELPYERMWPADTLYLPQLLAGKQVSGSFWLADDKSVTKYELH